MSWYTEFQFPIMFQYNDNILKFYLLESEAAVL